MDLDKRMNQSLDDIIQNKGRSNKSFAGKGKFQRAGKGPVKIAGLSKRGASHQGNPKRPEQKKVLTVKRSSLKRQGGGPSNGNTNQGNSARRNANSAPRKTLNARINTSLSNGANRNGKNQQTRRVNTGNIGKQPKRIVELPKLTDLRITIRNDQAPQYSAAAYYQSSMQNNYAASQFFPQQHQQQPASGYGPRGLQPRNEEASGMRTASDYPVPRTRSNFGTAKKAIRDIAPQPTRLQDFDQPMASGSYMRMDNKPRAK